MWSLGLTLFESSFKSASGFWDMSRKDSSCGPVSSSNLDVALNSCEALLLWPPDVKSQFTGKDPDAGKD